MGVAELDASSLSSREASLCLQVGVIRSVLLATVEFKVAKEAKGDEVGRFISATFGLRYEVVMLKVFLLVTGDAEREPHYAAPFKRR